MTPQNSNHASAAEGAAAAKDAVAEMPQRQPPSAGVSRRNALPVQLHTGPSSHPQEQRRYGGNGGGGGGGGGQDLKRTLDGSHQRLAWEST